MSSRKIWAFGTGVVLFVVVSLARAECFDLKGFALFQNAFGGPGCTEQLQSHVLEVPFDAEGYYGMTFLEEVAGEGYVATDFAVVGYCRYAVVRFYEKQEGEERLRIAFRVESPNWSVHLNSGIVFGGGSQLIVKWDCFDGHIESITMAGFSR